LNVLRVYVAGPYSASTKKEVEQNVKEAIEVGVAILKKGHYPYIPHLTHYVELLSQEQGLGLRWEDYVDWDLTWLEVCDAFLYMGSSKGADIELGYAKRLGKIIFLGLDEIPTIDVRHHNLKRLDK
jgi:hypothetical protein